jgi:uncharacterized protein YecE (DUF72 family)
MTLYAGTSGWAYKEWKPDFYPEKLPQKLWLEHYCTQLNACEINATFYRLQQESTVANWSGAAPEDFRFATKAHRRITHRRALAPDERTVRWIHDYLKSISGLGSKLGVVLFQFPPTLHRDVDGLTRFLESTPTGVKFAVEFRHESWSDPAIAELVANRGGTVCISDELGDVPNALPPGPLGYVRLRSERYDPWKRDAWRTLLAKEAADRPVFAFAKHEGIPASDPWGGIGLARWLARNA